LKDLNEIKQKTLIITSPDHPKHLLIRNKENQFVPHFDAAKKNLEIGNQVSYFLVAS
jgi:hypothetical protein